MAKMSLFPEISNRMDAATLNAAVDVLEVTHAELASRLDVDPKTVARWAKGLVPIPGSVALLLRVAMFTQFLGHSWNGPGNAAQDTPTKRVR